MSEIILQDLVSKSAEVAHYTKQLTNITNDLRTELNNYHTPKELGGTIIQRIGTPSAVMEVKEFDSTYVGDIEHTSQIYHAQKLGMKLRQLVVTLKGGSVAYESGQFLASSGDIKEGKVSLSPFEMMRGVVRKMNDESFFRPSLTGRGTVILESSLKFITLLPIKTETKVVMEKGIYLASVGQFEFKVTKNLNPSYMMFSEKSIFQTDARGTGILALELPVHINEIEIIQVTPESPLLVNGNYVLLWSGSLKREVGITGSVMGSVASGTGLVERYTGTGEVWLATTLGYYKEISSSLQGKDAQSRTNSIREGSQEGKREPTFLQKLFVGK